MPVHSTVSKTQCLKIVKNISFEFSQQKLRIYFSRQKCQMRYFFVIFKNCDKVKKLQSRLFIFMIFFFTVCAPQAECKARIHRPLCFCPPGYEGNPHVECTKSPSRAGLRFKRGFKSFILQSSSP